jgi:hypothetical protein
MSSNFKILAIIVISLLSSHCSKELYFPWNLCIKGTVIDSNTLEPIDEATIKVWVENSDSYDTLKYTTNSIGIFISERIDGYWFSKDLIVEASKKPYATSYWTSKNNASTLGEILDHDTVHINLAFYPEWFEFSVIPEMLDFQNNIDILPIVILNEGFGQIDWEIIENDDWIESWVSDAYNWGNDQWHLLSGGWAVIKIWILRENLSSGTYTSNITINTNAGSKVIPIYVTVD